MAEVKYHIHHTAETLSIPVSYERAVRAAKAGMRVTPNPMQTANQRTIQDRIREIIMGKDA